MALLDLHITSMTTEDASGWCPRSGDRTREIARLVGQGRPPSVEPRLPSIGLALRQVPSSPALPITLRNSARGVP